MELIRRLRDKFTPAGAATLQGLLLLGVLVIVNLLAFITRVQWDISEGKLHTLSPATARFLQGVKTPVKIVVVAEDEDTPAEELVKKFVAANPGLTSEYINPKKAPDRVKGYGVPRKAFVVVEAGKTRRWIPRLNEESLLGGILQVVKGGDKTVLFSSGHGELRLGDEGDTGLSKARHVLLGIGYKPEQAALTEANLKGAAVVVIAAPERPLTDDERKRVEAFLQAGGGLMVMVGAPPKAGLETLLRPFGVFSLDGRVVENNTRFRFQGSGSAIFVPHLPKCEHPLVRRLGRRSRMLFQWARMLAVAGGKGRKPFMVPLFASSDMSESVVTRKGKKVLLRRPGILAMASPPVPAKDRLPANLHIGRGRLFVSATASFAQDLDFGVGADRELWEIAVSWLAGDLDQPVLAQKEPHKSFNFNGPRDPRLRTVFITCVLVLPALFALGALVMFIRRTG